MPHLAQLNIGQIKYDLDDPRMADFVNNLEKINALAERMPGFVWRYQDESGNATSTKRDGDPRALLNMSVWESAEALETFVFGTVHAQFYARKAEWFDTMTAQHFVMWPVPEGHQPTIEEALERLAEYQQTGATDRVFGWDALPKAALWMEKRCA